jgi:hypothetical protein
MNKMKPNPGECNMKYTLTPSDDGKYIILKIKGEVNRQTIEQPNLEAHALGKKLCIERYLIDVTEAKNTDSILDSYEFAYTDMITTEEIDKNALGAILVSPGDHSHDFIETVLTNAGLRVKLFTDPDLAKSFLINK